MPLLNVSLEQDIQRVSMTNEERRAQWTSSNLNYKLLNTADVLRQTASNMTKFVAEFIQPKWIENNAPKPELGLMFAINKRILQEILSQDDCEGIRIYLSSDNGTKTGIVIKPVNNTIEDLDEVFPDRTIKICEDPTECPPETRCPSETYTKFGADLNTFFSTQLMPK